jgi:hypothetical protein
MRGKLERGEKRREAGRGAVSSGVVLAFYRGPGERRGEVIRSYSPTLMALTPLKALRPVNARFEWD